MQQARTQPRLDIQFRLFLDALCYLGLVEAPKLRQDFADSSTKIIVLDTCISEHPKKCVEGGFAFFNVNVLGIGGMDDPYHKHSSQDQKLAVSVRSVFDEFPLFVGQGSF